MKSYVSQYFCCKSYLIMIAFREDSVVYFSIRFVLAFYCSCSLLEQVGRTR